MVVKSAQLEDRASWICPGSVSAVRQGGGAWLRTDFNFQAAGVVFSTSETRSGWTVGIGGEYAVIDYLTSAMAFEPREQFRVLYLDKRNNLIADEVLAEGTVDHTPVYPREVLRRAIELHATGCVLVHNHPSGDATPSRADIEMTKQGGEVCKLLGIAVHDHVIIARDGHSSRRGLGLM